MINEALQIVSMVLCIIGIIQVIAGPKRWKASMFFSIVFYTVLFFYAALILISLRLEGESGELVHWVLVFSNLFEFLTGFFLFFTVSKWLLYRVDQHGEIKEIRLINKKIFVMYIIQASTLIVSQFTGLCYQIDSENTYRRGNGFFILILMLAISYIIMTYVMIRYRKRLSRKSLASFNIFAFVSATAIVLQFVFYGFYFITIAASVCALILYLLAVTEGTEMYLRQERENDKLKVDIMLSQIQPHFIFNSLTVIKRFCRYNPELAEKAIMDFS